MNTELLLSVIISVSIVSVLIGALLHLKSSEAIEMQRKFYLSINWRIEPVSMEKEIKNTKLMGLVMVLVGIFTTVAYMIIRV